jgi:CheY-like chemotaxis protein
VILDLKMEELNGFEVLKHLKGRYPELPVIVITGTFEGSEAEQAVKALGALACFTKPFELPALRRLVFEIAARLSTKTPPATSADALLRDSLSGNGTPA